jgi:hypothetical protein
MKDFLFGLSLFAISLELAYLTDISHEQGYVGLTVWLFFSAILSFIYGTGIMETSYKKRNDC